MKSRYLATALLTVAAGVSVSSTASAVTATGDLQVELTIEEFCLVTGATLEFANPGIIAVDLEADTTFTVQCTPTTDYTVIVGGTNADRAMTGPGSPIPYDLFHDELYADAWGAAIAPADENPAYTYDGAVHTYAVYGVVPALTGPARPTGTYAQTLTITVTY